MSPKHGSVRFRCFIVFDSTAQFHLCEHPLHLRTPTQCKDSLNLNETLSNILRIETIASQSGAAEYKGLQNPHMWSLDYRLVVMASCL